MEIAPSRGSSSTPRWALIGLLAVFALALWLRLDGIDHLLPYLPEPDNHVATQLWTIETQDPSFARPAVFRRYPLLLAYAAHLWPAAKPPAGDDLAAHLRAASTVMLRVRILTAVMSSLLVLLTWKLARKFAGPLAALVASFLVATSLLHLLFSQQARPHGAHATLALLAVLCAMRMRAKPTWGSYALAGLAAAAAVTCLQSGIAVLIPLVVAHLLRERGGETGRRPWWAIALPFLMIAVSAWALYPDESAAEGDRTTQDLAADSARIRQGGHELLLSELDGSGFVQMRNYLIDHDPVLLAYAILGAVLALFAIARRRRDRDLAVALAYAISYSLALGAYHQTYDRFLLPLLPYLACLAGHAVERSIAVLTRNVRQLGARALIAGLVAAPALVLPAKAAARYAFVRDAPDAVEQAAAWIRAHVDPKDGVILVTPSLTMPLFHDPATVGYNVTPVLASAWAQYQAGLPASATRGPCYKILYVPPRMAMIDPDQFPLRVDRQLDELRPAYVVVEASPRMLNIPIIRQLYDRVREQGERVFSAEGEAPTEPLQRPLEYQDMPRMLPRLLVASCLGPAIEIWRMPRR